MLVTINQMNWKKIEDSEMIMTVTTKGNIAKMFHAMIDGKYDEVANVFVATDDVETALETAYRLTQSIESAWIDNEDVVASDEVIAKGGCRSSSVGDVFQINDQFFAVAGCGFEGMTLATARAEKRAA